MQQFNKRNNSYALTTNECDGYKIQVNLLPRILLSLAARRG